MRPMPRDDLISVAVAESHSPNSTPPMRIPASPMSASEKPYAYDYRPIIYPMDISIGESHMPINEPYTAVLELKMVEAIFIFQSLK